MRYKNNILEKLGKFEITISKLVVQTNRNESQDNVLESLNGLKEEVEEMKLMCQKLGIVPKQTATKALKEALDNRCGYADLNMVLWMSGEY